MKSRDDLFSGWDRGHEEVPPVNGMWSLSRAAALEQVLGGIEEACNLLCLI